ncbi:MAG TPA: cytochrome d ubiquinol oxidase subunit II [Syntrophobacteraceae bacterium]|nr:cytochrome d ubiquinol oxidase subunit II [Syntrophobacteraceae bacterium]HBZ55212.1 cytochrome d ubiquinol oxidase subunit II [Syntrophobacteraceae bacterium]
MLESIWFVLWGVLWAVYFMLDGFDLGVGSLLPILGKTETDRRIMINTLGPFWDGNEVWLITAGGVTFAAFPTTYAVLFSSLYTPLMMLLFALILRGVAFEFRGKEDSPRWRAIWDACIVVGSFVPALLLGVAFANIFKGIPIDADGFNQGNLLTLLNPYGLMGGLLFVLLFLTHGCLWLSLKTEGDLQRRAAALAKVLWLPLLFAAVLFLGSTWFSTRLYDNYVKNPLMFVVPLALIPLSAVGGLVMIRMFIGKQEWFKGWVASAVTIVAATLFGVVGLYPNMLPSTINPNFNLTIHNSASSPLTLKIMLGVALTFVPVVIAYQIWVYHLFRGKVREEDLVYDESY